MNNGKICVSIGTETADEMIAKIKQAEKLADVIEVRFDRLLSDQIDPALELIESIQHTAELIATFRPAEQGGRREISFDERKRFWKKDHELFWAADLEEDVFSSAADWKPRIVSFHDLDRVPQNLETIFQELSSTGGDVIKIAAYADDCADAIPVWDLLKKAKAKKQQIIPIAMGEAGKWTRILGLAHGSFMTYASLEDGNETAPGQITVRDLIEVYRVKELELDTKVFGVIGDPVSGSLSPYMHNAAFVEHKINAVFIPFQVKDLGEFIRRMVKAETREVELNFAGFSITMPHKQAMMKYLHAIDPVAEKIGAVNTIKIHDDKLTGYNTDAYGFITPLLERFGDLKDARVAVFGTGGAARACVFALKREDADVTVFARDTRKAQAFADEFDIKIFENSKIKDQRSKIVDFDILVNATPMGMKGPLENQSLFTAEQLEGVKFVYDLVTSSTDTPLVREAGKAGVPAIGGIEMLIHQGAKQFEIWTGQAAPVEKMRDAILKETGQDKHVS